MKLHSSKLTHALVGALVFGLAASPALAAGAIVPSTSEGTPVPAPTYVPDVNPPIEMSIAPMACFAPGTPQEVVEYHAARALFHNLAVSLAANTEDRYNLTGRWSTTAQSGGGLGQGDPTIITWHVLADGLSLPGSIGEPSGPSNLRAFLDGIYGSEANWMPLFQQIFDSWGALTGFNYVYEPNDDGAAFPSSSGLAGVRADIRIGGHFIDGNSNVLAYNFFPNTGDMVIDTGDNFYSNTSNNSLGFRNVLAHEHGHGMGLLHVCPVSQTKLMEPFVSFAFDGPQQDDILAANRHYGDANEHNDTTGTSTDQGTPGSTTINLTDLSIDDVADSDFFSFTVGGGSDIDVTVTPVGSTYLSGPQNGDGSCSTGTSYNSLDNQDLKIEIIDLNGSTVVATGDSNGAGLSETLTAVALTSGAGKYWAKISGNSSADAQLYTMSLTIRDGGVGPGTGACCAGDGSCSEITASACTAAGGTYQGDGTTCGAVSCPVGSVLYDQTANPSIGWAAQDFETAYDAYDCEAADDFVVTDSEGWDVSEVNFTATYSSAGPLTQAHVSIHSDAAGTPGSAVCDHSSLSVTDNGGVFSIPLPATCQLPQGTYWLRVQPRMDFNPAGQIFWTSQTSQAGSTAAWQNPGDGFGSGCTSWGAINVCLAGSGGPDLTFQILGTVSGGDPNLIFADDFSSGDLSQWSSSVP